MTPSPFLSANLALPGAVQPDADEARSLLRRELLRPEYQDQDVVGRILDRLGRFIDGVISATAGASGYSTVVAMLLLVLLVVALVALASRVRRTARARTERRVVLADEQVSASELRARAEAAWREGRHEEAVVEGFRALTLRQVERGRLTDTPGATAHEVARSLAVEYAEHPDRARAVAAGAELFEQVLYGGRPARAEQARGVLDLDDDLAVLR